MLITIDGCSTAASPRPQWEVFVATDAPVPQLGEELLVEVLDDEGNLQSPASRRFIDASHASAWPISFGIVPDNQQASPRIRVRLYRLDETGANGLPDGASLLDATATLLPGTGLTRVDLVLQMACFGVASDPASRQTCDPVTKGLAPEPRLSAALDLATLPAPGSWPDARQVSCHGQVPPGMTCIPGGVFLLGTEHFFPATTATDPLPQRLVLLAPFALDTSEVTVGQVRALVREQGLPPPDEPNTSGSSTMRTEACTYRGVDDGSNDDAPANCLPWVTADRACHALGRRLPTESEWEYAARNLAEESLYPWGTDPDACDHAIVAQGFGGFVDATECEDPTSTKSYGPIAGGSALDVTELGILNLAGNVSEWVEDLFAPYAGGCWSGSAPLVDPACASGPAGHSIRGGSWQDATYNANSTSRTESLTDEASEAVGFRCAVSM